MNATKYAITLEPYLINTLNETDIFLPNLINNEQAKLPSTLHPIINIDANDIWKFK